MSRTKNAEHCLSELVEAGLSGDQRAFELAVVGAIRSLKKASPEVSTELGTILSKYSVNPSGLRQSVSPPPVDAVEGMSLLRISSTEDARPPVLSRELREKVERFLCERRESGKLLAEGFLPPGALLLTGDPGTGKTMLARWIANQLGLSFATLDLSTSVSSYLGKTGFNLRRTLDYARSSPCVLLLDEFDAIAKRRDDNSDLGELKRVVNVLLKELEDWPLKSVLIAATNHPELLDRAIQRRFDATLDLQLPGDAERLIILKQSGAGFSEKIPHRLLAAFAHCLDGTSGSDLNRMMVSAVRRHLTSATPLIKSLSEEVGKIVSKRESSRSMGELVRELHSAADGSLTIRELAEIFGRSPSTIQHHVSKEAANG